VCERDLRGDAGVVVADVRDQVVETVLELDVHAGTELLDVERGCSPVDPDLLTDDASVGGREYRGFGHACSFLPARCVWRAA
jgi:hypothetical protein